MHVTISLPPVTYIYILLTVLHDQCISQVTLMKLVQLELRYIVEYLQIVWPKQVFGIHRCRRFKQLLGVILFCLKYDIQLQKVIFLTVCVIYLYKYLVFVSCLPQKVTSRLCNDSYQIFFGKLFSSFVPKRLLFQVCLAHKVYKR